VSRTGAQDVRFCELFWETLEDHRGQAYYQQLRRKLAEFIGQKLERSDPVSARDKPFQSSTPLSGVWHFAIQRNPDVVIFYTLRGGLNFAMVGSHHDYGFHGQNKTAMSRTAARIHNALASAPRPTPQWKTFRWIRPSDVTGDGFLGDLHPNTLENLLGELEQEMATCARYLRANGREITEAGEEALDAYMAELVRAHETVIQVQDDLHAARRRHLQADYAAAGMQRPR
jgi:hypothetical protein